MIGWMTDLQAIRPLRDTNRWVKQLETQEAAPPSPLLATYSNPQKVRFAVFSYSPDQMKYQDAKTAWHRIFQPANHAAQEEGLERGKGVQMVSQPDQNGQEPQEANQSWGRGTASKRARRMTRRYWRAGTQRR